MKKVVIASCPCLRKGKPCSEAILVFYGLPPFAHHDLYLIVKGVLYLKGFVSNALSNIIGIQLYMDYFALPVMTKNGLSRPENNYLKTTPEFTARIKANLYG